MSRYIHVKIGLVDAVYPVLELCTTGTFNGFYHYRTGPTTSAWTHKQWCTPCTADGKPIDTESQDTDWCKFLREHWDTEHNHCKLEYLDEFYRIFRRAAATNIQKHEQENKTINEDNLQHGAHEPRRANEVPNTSGRHRPSPSMSTRDKEPVRTGKQMKPVLYAATDQPQPKKKPRYVELSLFD